MSHEDAMPWRGGGSDGWIGGGNPPSLLLPCALRLTYIYSFLSKSLQPRTTTHARRTQHNQSKRTKKRGKSTDHALRCSTYTASEEASIRTHCVCVTVGLLLMHTHHVFFRPARDATTKDAVCVAPCRVAWSLACRLSPRQTTRSAFHSWLKTASSSPPARRPRNTRTSSKRRASLLPFGFVRHVSLFVVGGHGNPTRTCRGKKAPQATGVGAWHAKCACLPLVASTRPIKSPCNHPWRPRAISCCPWASQPKRTHNTRSSLPSPSHFTHRILQWSTTRAKGKEDTPAAAHCKRAAASKRPSKT